MTKSRKFIAFATIVFLFISRSCTLYAQDDADNQDIFKDHLFLAGIVVGANFNQVDGDYFAGYNKIGANIGGAAYLRLPKHKALSMEILYSQKGAQSTINRGAGKDTLVRITDYGITLNYAEVPIMLNVFDKNNSHAGLGLSYAKLISYKEALTTDPANLVNLSDFPFKKSDLCIVAAGSLKVWKGLYLNVKFQYSLTPIRREIPQYYARSSQYNNTWTCRLMYLF